MMAHAPGRQSVALFYFSLALTLQCAESKPRASAAQLKTALVAPKPNQTVTGVVTLLASAAGSNPMVDFTLDGSVIGTRALVPPFSTFWDTSTAGNGSHVLGVIAHDDKGSVVQGPRIAVVVANPNRMAAVTP
jgi:hypothetical protein